MGKLIAKRFKSASILETIVALSISAFMFGLVSMLCVQLTKSSSPQINAQAKELLNDYAVQTHEEYAYFDETKEDGEFVLERKIEDNHEKESTVIIHFTVFDSGRKELYHFDRLHSSK